MVRGVVTAALITTILTGTMLPLLQAQTAPSIAVTGAAQASRDAIPAPPGPDGPRFEVASVKPRTTDDRTMGLSASPGRLTISGYGLASIVMLAYFVPDQRIAGIPSWAVGERFDIEGRTAGDTPRPVMLAMLRALLADRFKLVAHLETRSMPVYVLTLENRDGRLGPQMRATTADCSAIRAERQQKLTADGAPAQARSLAADDRPLCELRFGAGRIPTTTRYWTSGTSMASLAEALGPFAGRAVVDRTGLKGEYDLELTFVRGMNEDSTGPTLPPELLNGAVSLRDALRQQLGLVLREDRGQDEVLVIDSLQRPTEN